MEKISIKVNGQTIDLEGKSLSEISEHIIETFAKLFEIESDHDIICKEDINKDIPKPYINFEEYLSLNDLDFSKCTTEDIYRDLKEKLEARLKWAKTHKEADLDKKVKLNLDLLTGALKHSLKALKCQERAITLINLYCSEIKNITKK